VKTKHGKIKVWLLSDKPSTHNICLGSDGVVYDVYQHGEAEKHLRLEKLERNSSLTSADITLKNERLSSLLAILNDEKFLDQFTENGKLAEKKRKSKIDKSLYPEKEKSFLVKTLDAVMPTLIVIGIVVMIITAIVVYYYCKYAVGVN
jgi:hypothetical protein